MLQSLLPAVFAVVAVGYFALGAWVFRTSPRSSVSAFVVLLGVMLSGSAFAYAATDPLLFGIGRVLTMFGAGFLPVAFYVVYREHTDGDFNRFVIAALSLIPAITVALAITNPLHGMIWQVVETSSGLAFTRPAEHLWFRVVHAPFLYGLFGYSIIALVARLSTIAKAHRPVVLVLLVAALAPFATSIAHAFLGAGPQNWPATATSVILVFPLLLYAALSMRAFEFSPIGYKALFNHVSEPIVVLDDAYAIVCANEAAARMLDKTEKQLLGRKFWEELPEVRDLLRDSPEIDLTQTLKFSDDLIYEINIAPLYDKKGRSQGSFVMFRDVTQRRRTLGQLAQSEHLIRTLIETSSNGILRFAPEAIAEHVAYRCVFANQAASDFIGLAIDEIIDAPLASLRLLDPERLAEHFDNPRKSAQTSFELSTRDAEGGVSWLRITAEPVGADFSVNILDITQRKLNEDKMLEQALRDPLTGVLNRRGFEAKAVERLRSAKTAALLYLDLNGFKQVNDRYGHPTGDALLKAFGHRLDYCLRPEDVLGRLGGDEFAIVLPDISGDDVGHISDRLIQSGEDAYIIRGEEIHCSVSVGIATMPEHGEELWHLVSVADQAMYTAKARAANDDEDSVPSRSRSTAS